jgi:protoheme IX farnesyltransferase
MSPGHPDLVKSARHVQRARFFAMQDFWQLTRPRLVLTVLFTVGVAACCVPGVPPSGWYVVHTLIGTALVIVGAIAFNQLIERDVDARMARTESRPLPAKRLSPRSATLWGLATSAVGIVYLALLTKPAVAVTATASWCIYVCLYTPLKRVTVWHTAVGAVSGAMPMLIGAAAVDATFHPVALTLFGVGYLWQFPHTMAIGYLYRDQYAAAGIRVAPVADKSGRLAGLMAVGGSAALIPGAFLLAQLMASGWVFAVCAVLLSAVYLAFAVRFARRYDERAARLLLRFSLVYLPLLLGPYLLLLLLYQPNV